MSKQDPHDPRQLILQCRELLVRASDKLRRLRYDTEDLRLEEAAVTLRSTIDSARQGLDYLFPEVRLDTALDDLLRSSDWEHPTQMLEHPRPDFGELLELCDVHLGRDDTPCREQLAETRRKLARAVRIAENARRRRATRRSE